MTQGNMTIISIHPDLSSRYAIAYLRNGSLSYQAALIATDVTECMKHVRERRSDGHEDGIFIIAIYDAIVYEKVASLIPNELKVHVVIASKLAALMGYENADDMLGADDVARMVADIIDRL